MKNIFYIIWQYIQALFLLFVLVVGVFILWLKGDIKFEE
jgi:cellulose synthase/poly-beta-1,6-N-acetylglucosamine synthase-like glycosyltransferase